MGPANFRQLREIIQAEVRRAGIIPFARFMELALYHPACGYYEQPGIAPGRGGDFYTSVSVGSLFGELLAFQFARWLAALPGPRQIVEAGAHDGRLAGDVLRWFARHQAALVANLEYWLIEPSPRRREVQARVLAEFAPRVRWFESWSTVPAGGVQGVIFSNELLDAFPCHRLAWDAVARQWYECGVTLRDDEFTWALLPAPTGLAPALPAPLLDVLPDGFATESCPAASGWWRQAARSLRAGKLLTLDYGLTREQFFVPERAGGTARAYQRHRVSQDLLADPGEQDLTAHVNFSEVREAGEAEGLHTADYLSQGQFLTRILQLTLAGGEAFDEWTGARTRQFQALTHPEHLGRSFRVLVQERMNPDGLNTPNASGR